MPWLISFQPNDDNICLNSKNDHIMVYTLIFEQILLISQTRLKVPCINELSIETQSQNTKLGRFFQLF